MNNKKKTDGVRFVSIFAFLYVLAFNGDSVDNNNNDIRVFFYSF